MRKLIARLLFPALLLSILLLFPLSSFADANGRVQGIVHDPQHRPVAGASITLHSSTSDFVLTAISNSDGFFQFPTVPLGEYALTVAQTGFATESQTFTLASDTSPVLHFELPIATVEQSVTVSANPANVDTVTPTTLVNRLDILETPGADRAYGMQMITDYVPGAYMTHDMLHMRGGHQVTWQIDGVQIPNTNIASNLGPQIIPGDIDYLETQRGSYTADEGDRTYGIFNVVPRSGFDGNNDGELVLSGGNFFQTNDQLSFASHTEKLAYYASLNGNRSDYGLAPPIGQTFHDAANGQGGFTSLIYNKTPRDQLRFVGSARTDFFQIPYDPDPNSFGNQQYDSSGLRDTQREIDSFAAFTWAHSFSPATTMELSPLYHLNTADYNPNPIDTPTATTSRRTSQYAGLQGSVETVIANNTLQAGIYSWGQHDSDYFNVVFNDPTGQPPVSLSTSPSGGLIEAFISDNYKITPWLTAIGGIRQSHFQSGAPASCDVTPCSITDNYTAPRIGLALEIPKLHWVLRGFYGRFYQPPPLASIAGPILDYAQQNDTSFVPLHGERDEEHQFGLQIPYRGWMLDADTFQTRANNFLDHSNIGASSIYIPVTVQGALIQAWELSIRSPRLWQLGQFHLAYSNQIAQQRGPITGGLICYPITSPQCDAGFDYEPVDHDQRNTLNVGFNAQLPHQIFASTNVYYGSGFVNGDPDPSTPYPNDYLPEHTTFDLSLGKKFSENFTGSLTALNVANRRVLLDNSLTFGGFHYNDPRQIYAEVRWRFHY
jgi:hypothetical protein